jgi:hypothetical protein
MKTLTHKTIKKESKKIPLFADGQYLAGKVIYKGLRKVGYKIVEFTYDVDHYLDGHADPMLIGMKELKRVIY